jgi:hypothetical protein
MIKRAMTDNSRKEQIASLDDHQFVINKNDGKYLTKLQIKKAQYLFENDYFIWNEAEMYLRVSASFFFL